MFYTSAVALLFALAASRASRGSLLVVAAIGVAFSRSWLLVPAGAALAVAFAAAFPVRAYKWVGALVGALTVQVELRWPAELFHGFTVLVAGVSMAAVMVSALRQLNAPIRRRIIRGSAALVGVGVLLSIPLAVTGLLAKTDIDSGTAAARSALARVDQDDAPSAVQDLGVASADLGRALSGTDQWWTAGAELVPVVSQQRRAAVDVTRSGRDLAAAAGHEVGRIDFHTVAYHDGQIDLAAVQALRAPVDALDAQMVAAQAVVTHSRSAWLVGPIARPLGHLASELAKAKADTDLAVEGLSDAPGLLGADGVRHYFVAFMTPAETRGLDGFIGAYAELTADQGRITLTRAGRANQLVSPQTGVPHLAGPADYLYRYGAFEPQANFEDVTYSPDFPTVEDVIAQLYPQVGGDRLDGVLALDPYGLAALLQFTGPLTVPGLPDPLTAANAANVLIRQQYVDASLDVSVAARHDLLQQALGLGFHKLLSGSLPAPEALASALGPEVRQGRLLFWTADPADWPLLRKVGLAGSFPDPGPSSDLLAVTIANGANNKIDAYLDESVAEKVTYDPSTGHVHATVTISLRNTAPAAGLPPYVIGSYAGSGLPLGTNYMWLSLYSPLDVVGATLSGKRFDLANAIPELGVKAYSGYVDIPSDSSRTLVVTLDGSIAVGPSYRTAIRLQPLANPSTTTISVSPAPGWRLAAPGPATWIAGIDMVQVHAWNFAR